MVETPWLLFDPHGVWDGLMWSPKTAEEAGRKFARPRRWATMAREGWTVRKGEPGEHARLLQEHLGLPAASEADGEAT